MFPVRYEYRYVKSKAIRATGRGGPQVCFLLRWFLQERHG
jgi:hypothetical protein